MDDESIRVLLIEENADDARRVEQMLGPPDRSPFAVEHVESLDGGLAYLDEQGTDVVLLGLAVPGALAIGKVDRVHTHCPHVPIIALTSLDETQVFLDTARGGAIDYMVKGRLDARELSRAIRYAIERTRMAEARRRAEASLREVVTSSADAMVVVDAGGTVCFANPAAEALFGRQMDELVGKPFDFAAEVGQTTEVEIPRNEGMPAIAEMRVVPTEWEGESALLASLRDITESVRMREELRSLSLRDELTGLYNRRGFTTLAQQQLKLANRTSGMLLLVFADLDGLKAINDKHGHTEGDRALQTTAQVLEAGFRESDIIARVGGDEFAILAVGAHDLAAETVTQRLQAAVDGRFARKNLPYKLSLSIGAIQYNPAEPCSLEDMLARADAAMYEQKRRRRAGQKPGG